MSFSHPWLFLSELLLIGGVWMIIAELNDNFCRKDFFERMIEESLRKKTLSRHHRKDTL